jgi:polyhydroxybutyrate depolymerase
MKKLILLTLTLACATAQAGLRERLAERRAQREQSAVQQTGLHEQHLVQGELTRTYLVYLPKGLDVSRPTPVVYVFHGGGGHAAYMTDDDRYGWLAKADAEGFLAVFPSGYSKLPGGRFATWNAGGCCGDARDRQVDDVGFVRAVHARVSSQFKVDQARVYATGMSNGGMMSHRLACEAADLFAAVAPVAGTDATASCQPSRPVAVLHTHARNDDHVLFDGGAGPNAFRDEAKVMDFVSVPETISRWVKRNQCAASPKRVLSVPGAYCDAYAPCAGGTSVQLCVTAEGGHSWPGAASTRLGKAPASQAIQANEVIWRFFAQSHR